MLTCLYDVVGYALLGSMCLRVYFHVICLDPCLHMLVCLDLRSSIAFMLTSTCLDVHSHVYMYISLLICVDRCLYVLRSMFLICFILSSMCLCTPCHVCVLRPRLCLTCHVLL